MTKYLITLFIIIFTFQVSFADPDPAKPRNRTITGKILDKDNGLPLEYATISFWSVTEKKLIDGCITDTSGAFSIKLSDDTYNITIEYISYKTYKIFNKKIDSDEDLGVILLEIDFQSLGEVEIIAEKTTVEIKLDKKIYNVGRDLTVRGGTVSDVLDNVPSVSVDIEGNVSLRGNDNVRILINGKPSGLVGLNSTDALRQLPAESIERVEVITSPSARYDAEGTAGILNIILRRSKLQGLNGAITLNGGYPTQAGVSGNINYRIGDLNIFNTTGYSYRKSPGNAFTDTEYFNGDDPSTFLNETRDFDRIRKGITTNVGVEWYVNNSTSITNSLVYRDSNNSSETTNEIRETDINGNLLNELFRFDPEREDDKTIQYSFNFDKQFNENSEHRLTFDFQYENSTEDEKSLITQDGDDAEKVRTLENQKEILLQGDFVQPIGDQSQFELGYRGTFNELDTDYTLEFNESGNFVLNTDLSNNLIYREYVNALYSQFGSKIKEKFSFLLGLRMEATRISINQITSNDFERKNYIGLFPTINLGYEISENQSLTLGYNRRVRRPRSRYINPFPSRSSATNLFQGNPDIDPSYSNNFDLGYLNKMGKLTLNSSIYFQHATDVFTFITLDSGETTVVGGTEVPIIQRSPVNLATNDQYGFEFTLTYRPTKKWNMNGNFNLFQSVTKGDYEGTNFDAENLSWFIRLNNKYTLPGDIDWQTRLFYIGPREDAQNKTKGMFIASLAFSKDLFKDNGSLAVNVSDIFNGGKRQTNTLTDTFGAYSEYQRRVRSVNFSFTYRFNQKKKRNNRDMNGNGAPDDMDFEKP